MVLDGGSAQDLISFNRFSQTRHLALSLSPQGLYNVREVYAQYDRNELTLPTLGINICTLQILDIGTPPLIYCCPQTLPQLGHSPVFKNTACFQLKQEIMLAQQVDLCEQGYTGHGNCI